MKGLNSLKPKMLGFILAGALTVFSTTSFGQTSETLKGEVLDLSCYMTSGAMGKGHKSCAQGCLNKGLPAGLLANGKVYLLVEDHKNSAAYQQALKHAAENVAITGKVISKNGVQSVVVESVKTEG